MADNNCADRDGEMARRIQDFDWASSALGAMGEWPASLRYTLNAILPASAQAVLFVGPEMVAIYNDAYAAIMGRKHPHALGQPAQLYWEETWTELEPMLAAVFRDGKTIAASDRLFQVERFGFVEDVFFDLSYSALRDDDNAVIAVLCIVKETTARVRARQALEKSTERLRALFSQASAGIALMDVAGHFEMVNAQFCEALGYRESEILGLHFEDIIHPDERHGYRDLALGLSDRFPGMMIEQRCLRRDGTTLWVSSSLGAVRDDDGRVCQISVIMKDMTERRRAEAHERRLAAIIASSDDAILSTDLAMRITSWNVGAEQLYGYSAEEAIGQSVAILVPPEHPTEEATILARIRAGHRVEPHETTRLRKGGKPVEVSLTASPIYDESGAIIGASKIARDITQRKDAERVQLVLLNEMKHRVKNTLATVLAIARQTFGKSQTDATEIFHARIRALARAQDLMTKDLRDGADLTELLGEILAPYSPKRFRFDGEKLLLAPKIALVFALAIHELATNAAKYGALSNGDGWVEIDWRCCDDLGELTFSWRERNGPTVVATDQKGFGSILIEDVVSAELTATVQLDHDPGGLVFFLRAPLDAVRALQS